MPKEIHYYEIDLSSDKIDPTGLTMDESLREEVERIEFILLDSGKDRKLTEDEINKLSEKIRSKREAEKEIVQKLVYVASKQKTNTGLARYNKLASLAARIKDSDEKFEIDSEEIEWVRSGFSEIQKDAPAWWFNCIELFDQLENPRKKEAQVTPEQTG